MKVTLFVIIMNHKLSVYGSGKQVRRGVVSVWSPQSLLWWITSKGIGGTGTHTRRHRIPTFSGMKRTWRWPAASEGSWNCLWTFLTPPLTSLEPRETLSLPRWGAFSVTKSSPFSRAGQESRHKGFWVGPAPGGVQPLWEHSDGNNQPLSPFPFSYSWKPISCFNLILMNRNTLLAWRMRNYCIIGSNHTEHKKPFKVIKLLPSPFLYFFSAPRWWAVYLCHHNSRGGSQGNGEPFSARAHAERAELRQTLSFLAAKAF